MGKVFGYNKRTLTALVVLMLLLVHVVNGDAAYREYDLLQKGYERYLSYQPGEASEEFRVFLREFPGSSARDAALFWLGKSLIQLKSYEDAGRVFEELRQQIPDSPFIAFIGREPEIPGKDVSPQLKELSSETGVETAKVPAVIPPTAPVEAATPLTPEPEKRREGEVPSDISTAIIVENKPLTADVPALQTPDTPPLSTESVPVAAAGDQKEPVPQLETGTKSSIETIQKPEAAVAEAEVNEMTIEELERAMPPQIETAAVPSQPLISEKIEENKGQPSEPPVQDISVTQALPSPEVSSVKGAEEHVEALLQPDQETKSAPEVIQHTEEPAEKTAELKEKTNEAAESLTSAEMEAAPRPSETAPSLTTSEKIEENQPQQSITPEPHVSEIPDLPSPEPASVKTAEEQRETVPQPEPETKPVIETTQKTEAPVAEAEVNEMTIEELERAMPVHTETAQMPSQPAAEEPPKITLEPAGTIAEDKKELSGGIAPPDEVTVSSGEKQRESVESDKNLYVAGEAATLPGTETKIAEIAAVPGSTVPVSQPEEKARIEVSVHAEDDTSHESVVFENRAETTSNLPRPGDEGTMIEPLLFPAGAMEGSAAEKKEPEGKGAESILSASMQEPQKTEQEPVQLTEVKRETPDTANEQVQPEIPAPSPSIEGQPISDERIRTPEGSGESAGIPIPETPESYGVNDPHAFMVSAAVVLNKVGVQGALWSTGDSVQDFETEELLFREAEKMNIPVDEKRLAALTEQYVLDKKEAGYLERFLRICQLIDKKLLEVPQDHVIEVLSVKYAPGMQNERAELAAELQTFAKNGVTFENISRSYPDVVEFRTFSPQELPVWIQERIQGLQMNEIGVLWSEEGYMILKPTVHTLSYDPFGEMPLEKREKILSFLTSWIKELKAGSVH